MLKQSDSNIKIRIVSIAIFILTIGFSSFGIFNTLENTFYDLIVTLRVTYSPLKQSPKIIPVDLNDRAERNLGDSLNSRQAFVDLFSIMEEGEISGAMDFIFQGYKNPAIDEKMAQVTKEIDNLVLSIIPVPENISTFSGKELTIQEKNIIKKHLWYPKVIKTGSIPEVSTFILPKIELLKSANHLGHIGVLSDNDGIYRKLQLLYKWEDGYLPTLSLAMVASYYNIKTEDIILNPGFELVIPINNNRKIRIPIDDNGSIWIPYPAMWDEGWDRIPLDTVVNTLNDEDSMYELIDIWSDGIVIVADITTSHKDFGVTPFENVYPLSGLHTSLLNGILTDTFYTPTSLFIRLTIILYLISSIWILSSSKKHANLGYFLTLLVLVAVICFLWFNFLIIPWLIAPLIGLILSWLYNFILSIYNTHEKNLLLKNALNRYVPSSLADRVIKEKSINLFPAIKKLTIIFTDISGFTKWSSEKSPELVHGFLSEYLELMASIIFKHGGTIDKFMGDGILAFFGDPWTQDDHESRCLDSALEMQDIINNHKNNWKAKYSIDLSIRIGVNTGTVIVGNLGTKTRIEYTVIGAPVNLAQRMESNAPLGEVLVSENTWQNTKSKFEFSSKKIIHVKGYEEGIPSYILKNKK